MSLSVDQARYVATLARLKLTEDEEVAFAEQLSSILDFINQLNKLDTSHIEPTSRAVTLNTVCREDVALKRFDDGAWRKNAPSVDQDHLRVPRVIEE